MFMAINSVRLLVYIYMLTRDAQCGTLINALINEDWKKIVTRSHIWEKKAWVDKSDSSYTVVPTAQL